MAELWDAIEAENGEKIAEMLSAGARNEIEDYERKIENFIDAFQGEILSVTEITTASSGSRDNRKTTCYEITGMYDIETTEGIYSLDFSYILIPDIVMHQQRERSTFLTVWEGLFPKKTGMEKKFFFCTTVTGRLLRQGAPAERVFIMIITGKEICTEFMTIQEEKSASFTVIMSFRDL